MDLIAIIFNLKLLYLKTLIWKVTFVLIYDLDPQLAFSPLRSKEKDAAGVSAFANVYQLERVFNCLWIYSLLMSITQRDSVKISREWFRGFC